MWVGTRQTLGLTIALAMLGGCAGTYLVPLNGQSDMQRKLDGKECEEIGHEAGRVAIGNPDFTTGPRVAAGVIIALLGSSPQADRNNAAYDAAYTSAYSRCYTGRGYRYATEGDYK